MDKYEVIKVIGEGSFGRVYKAKVMNTCDFVALKLIVKNGRTDKEIKGLNQECEILRKLRHPNIIPMIEFFETDTEIVVITEYVERELFGILRDEGPFQEDRVTKITCDLVSALHYLHSNRVLHRDLKPQNVLLDNHGTAKLCDFGFARCMGLSTHVLTSIKGTPLYMAPELIDGRPYDHTADLWSLGCIAYELLVGKPPFSTTSILQLVHLIQNESISWPDFLTPECRSFLQGLLQKRPDKRMSWQEILRHDFLKNCTLNVDPNAPLVFPTETVKNAAGSLDSGLKDNFRTIKERLTKDSPLRAAGKTSSCPSRSNLNKSEEEVEKKTVHSSLIGMSKNIQKEEKLFTSLASNMADLKVSADGNINEEGAVAKVQSDDQNKDGKAVRLKKSGQVFTLHSWDSAASARPIENEEWLAFLQRNMEEIIAGQLDCLKNHNLVSVLVAPLRNISASPRVLEYISNMLALPFVVDGTSDKELENIKQVYLEIKVIPNLVYASKNIARRRGYDSEASSPSVAPGGSEVLLRPVSEFSADELQALESIYLLVCHLVHCGEDFLIQFCDAAAILNTVMLMQQFLLLGRRKVRIVMDLLAILNLTMRDLPENGDVVELIVLGSAATGKSSVDLSRLLAHPSGVVRSRTCELVRHLCGRCPYAVQAAWTPRLDQDLHALLSDSVPSVRTAAEEAYQGVKRLPESKTG